MFRVGDGWKFWKTKVTKELVKDSRGQIYEVTKEQKFEWTPILILSAGIMIFIAYGIDFYLMSEPYFTGCETEKKHIIMPAGKIFVPMDITVCKKGKT